ncbi:MAG: N-6 DNA methylase [Candidatus Omnitrophica bacterium]|nr:N-6 DNA methylase [Candidatus Omnitrophota bacterium]
MITKAKEKAKRNIRDLVLKFHKHESYYTSKEYKEAEVRLSFIDNFFRQLGWDVDSRKLISPEERDVIIEKSVENETNKKFVDYTFRINGKAQFLVEAKKPYEKLTNKEHVFQAKYYAFSAGIPFVILTNFREFRLFNIKVKPLLNQPDTDLVRNFDIAYSDILSSFDLLWGTFHRDNVKNGSLIKLYLKLKGTVSKIIGDLNYACIKGSSLLNDEFLKDLLRWRRLLANNIFRYNRGLSSQDINEVVQRTLDRIIFLRILEDRGIECKELLREALWKLKNNNIKNLKQYLDGLYESLNKKYNGLLFHSHGLSNKTIISNDVLTRIIGGLYYPVSPYNFKEISTEILGRIFEQYLGVTITIKKKSVFLELKPELRKGGGVYCTPQEIVDEIVKATVSTFLTNKNISNYKVIDITCGSGSFLISAYKALIKYYEKQYSDRTATKAALRAKEIFYGKSGVQLTSTCKKKILEKHIYGVDIDPQAVEVSKMSLYITMLEDGNTGTTPQPILPDLANNIKCGNSIIDTDYFTNYKYDSKIYAFDWCVNFGKIVKNGFDCIIGNPPYIRIQTFEKIYSRLAKKYINDKYESSRYGNFDISVVFIEKALSLLKKDGIMGFIVPNKLLTSEYGEGFRDIISSRKYLYKVVHFTDQQIFSGSTTYTCLLFLQKKPLKEYEFMKVTDIEKWKSGERGNFIKMATSKLDKTPWYFSTDNFETLEKKLSKICVPLTRVCERIFVGLQTDCDQVYLLEEVSRKGKIVYCKSDYTDQVHPFEANHLKRVLKGSLDISRYIFNKKRRIIFPYELGSDRPPLIKAPTYKKKYPLTWKYIKLCEKRLRRRNKGKLKKNNWYGYIYKKNHSRFEQQKLVTSSLCSTSRFAFDESGKYYFVGSGIGGGGGYGIIASRHPKSQYNYLSLLGVLNSNLMSYFILKKGSPFSGGWVGIDKHFIDKIPVPIITSRDIRKLKLIRQLEKNVSTLLTVLNEREKSNNSSANERYNNLLTSLDFKIDEIVYSLYDLNKAEIKGISDYLKINKVPL